MSDDLPFLYFLNPTLVSCRQHGVAALYKGETSTQGKVLDFFVGG